MSNFILFCFFFSTFENLVTTIFHWKALYKIEKKFCKDLFFLSFHFFFFFNKPIPKKLFLTLSPSCINFSLLNPILENFLIFFFERPFFFVLPFFSTLFQKRISRGTFEIEKFFEKHLFQKKKFDRHFWIFERHFWIFKRHFWIFERHFFKKEFREATFFNPLLENFEIFVKTFFLFGGGVLPFFFKNPPSFINFF